MNITDVIFLILMIYISVSDLKSRRIPNKANIAIMILGFVNILITKEEGPAMTQKVAGLFVISGLLLVFCIVNRGGIGGGDIKLMAAGGFYLGFDALVEAAAAGFFLAGIYALILLIFGHKSKDEKFPLGPFLCAGMGAKILLKLL